MECLYFTFETIIGNKNNDTKQKMQNNNKSAPTTLLRQKVKITKKVLKNNWKEQKIRDIFFVQNEKYGNKHKTTTISTQCNGKTTEKNILIQLKQIQKTKKKTFCLFFIWKDFGLIFFYFNILQVIP